MFDVRVMLHMRLMHTWGESLWNNRKFMLVKLTVQPPVRATSPLERDIYSVRCLCVSVCLSREMILY
jgi:hypothetical protein